MGSLALRAGLRLADLGARWLPRGLAYGLADLAGRAWHRLAPDRRALVAENLRRVCAATGRPTSGGAFERLVRSAFVAYARYYLELLRAPYYPAERLDEFVSVDEWERWEPLFRSGTVVALPHLGNFEPFGSFLAAHGLSGIAPVEETEPHELYEFLRARRASGRGVEVVPLSKSRRPLVQALRDGRFAALVADRDLAGDGIPVTMFGLTTTLPAGPASLALMTGRPIMAAAVFRDGPDRFRGRGWTLDVPLSGDRRADTVALTEAVARRFEEAIALAPEQWFAAFQPYWSDQRTQAPL
jgi:KDO2-lipid IV(A) lauroyltransferase